MNTTGTISGQSARISYFDWLRTLAFIFVVLIHCVQMFAELYQPLATIGVKSINDGATYGLSFVTQWAMALFFVLAGASTWQALRRRTARQFLRERFQRLLVPLIIGCVLLMPLQAYFEMSSNQHYSGSLIAFYPFFLGQIVLNGRLNWIILSIHHLWFLAYLFGFSLIALPLCLYLRRATGRAWMERLARIYEQPGCLLLLALPLITIQVALHAAFPVYCSLADATDWLLCYLCGYILFANPRFRFALRQQGIIALSTGCAGFLIMLLLWHEGALHSWLYAPDYSSGCLFFQALNSLTLWSWLIAVLAIGDMTLNKTCPFLRYSSAASFQWYIVHFPVVIMTAYYLLPLRLNPLATFLMMAGSSLTITYILSDLLLLKARGTRTLLHALQTPVAHYRSNTGRLNSQALVS
jgi:peptidoglycan/LPS O-acetylase OafA/YrhL